MSSRDKGVLFEDTMTNKRSRTVPIVDDLVPVVDKWSEGKTTRRLAVSRPERWAVERAELEAIRSLVRRD